MIKRLSDVLSNKHNVFLFWEGPIPKHIVEQIRVCLNSVFANKPEAIVYLFSNTLNEAHLSDTRAVLVRWDFSLADGTPLAGQMPKTDCGWCQWSDVFRILCLWRWGGTYLDVDDIMVRQTPAGTNIMAACFLSADLLYNWRGYLIPGFFAASRGTLEGTLKFRFGADPMTNFRPQNPFLERWMRLIPKRHPGEWGQVLPTEVFFADPEWSQNYIAPVIWSDLLYHPYDGGHYPADKRYCGSAFRAETLVTEKQFEEYWRLLLDSYGFYLVKNDGYSCHAFLGELQPLLRWIVQHLWRRFSKRVCDDSLRYKVKY